MSNRHALRRIGPVLAGFLTASCVIGAPTGFSGGRLSVVVGEDVWGSLAAQLGGDLVSVTSIVTNPHADPHDYEPTAADARLVASAGFVIENGIGYDTWMQRLVDANPSSRRHVLDVGDLVGVTPGGNPHQWYSPSSVQRVIDAISSEYARRDPAHAADFAARKQHLESVALRPYLETIQRIKAQFAGTPVGASESVFAEMAPALGLDLVTPPTFLVAISEGTEATAADKATIDEQIRSREIHVYVENTQNTTPDVLRQVEACRAAGIPVATITETLVPKGASFQDWQTRQLMRLLTALTAWTP
jgi:zinc/manganese transport system substrate-binding protein